MFITYIIINNYINKLKYYNPPFFHSCHPDINNNRAAANSR